MTILMMNILSIPAIALVEDAGWVEWFKGLPGWQSFALFLGFCVVIATLINWLAGDRILEFFEEWKKESEKSRKREIRQVRRRHEERERERTMFFNQTWQRKEASFELNKLRKELEGRNNPWAKRYMPNLSVEDLRQRIDFLEALEFDGKEKPSLSLAERRIACRKLHDNEREKELQELSNAFFDNEAARTQEVRDTYNFWNNKKRNALQNIGRAERNDNVTA
jgi:hypothetical protein